MDLKQPHIPPTRNRLLVTAIVVLAFAIPAAALIPLQLNGGPRFDDQNSYHVPTIWEIATAWPNLDVNAYTAAMTPGYHLVMAFVARAGGGLLLMQALTALLSCGFFATLAWAVSRRMPAVDAVLVCLPAVFSPYIFTAGIAAVPHNVAWWGVLAILLLAMGRIDARVILAFGVIYTCLVLVMQIQAWTLAPMLVAAWLADDRSAAGANAIPPRRQIQRSLAVLLAALPAALALAWFARQWGGLAPHKQEWVQSAGGVNLASIVMILATCGAIGVFYLARYWERAAITWAVIGAVSAIIIAAIPETTYDVNGRWGGLWNLARVTPHFGERSPIMIALAGAGGFVIGALLAGMRGRQRWIFAAALAGFIAAHSTINQAWQRYYEPMILLTLILAASRIGVTLSAGRMRLSRVLLIAIMLIQMGLTVVSLRG